VVPKAAIKAGEGARLLLAVPTKEAPLIEQALRLIHLYGAAGGRSRNGWGSLVLDGVQVENYAPPLRDWKEALALDWPHAIGKDNAGALIWQTDKTYEKWALSRNLWGPAF